jgi:antirestriction protein
MNTPNFDVVINYMNEDFNICLDSSLCTESDILEALQELKKESFEEQSGEDFEGDFEETFEITDWLEIPEFLQDLETFAEFIEVFEGSSYGIEIFEAANYLDIPFSDIDEAYSGEFDNDEDFARNMADDLGVIDKNPSWPYTCIDWEQAASELMYDYAEHNNHYFRSL